MKLDPNKHCVVYEQNLFWAIIHDVIAHPLMGICCYNEWSRNIHNITSHKAWKRTNVVTEDKSQKT